MTFGEIRCPHCGYDGVNDETSANMLDVSGGFRYLEDITCWRRVSFVEAKDMHIDGFYQTGEGYDDGENRRLQCGACLREFPLAEKFELWFD